MAYMEEENGSRRKSFYAGLIRRQRRKVKQLDRKITRIMVRAARGEDSNSSEEEDDGYDKEERDRKRDSD